MGRGEAGTRLARFTRLAAEGMGKGRGASGPRPDGGLISTVSTKTDARRDCYSSGRGAQAFSAFCPTRASPLRRRTQPLSCGLGSPGNPERTFGRAEALAVLRWAGLRPPPSFKHADTDIRPTGGPARSPLTAVAGRRPDECPPKSRLALHPGQFLGHDRLD